MVFKGLNGCGVNNRYWVFAAGLTDVRTVFTITDTEADYVDSWSVSYISLQGEPFDPIQDTLAFPTCR